MEKLKRLKIAMIEKGIKNYSELGNLLGISRQEVHSFTKTLQTGKPKEETLQKYADVLGITVDKLK